MRKLIAYVYGDVQKVGYRSKVVTKVDMIDHEYSEPTGSFDSFYKLVREGEPEGRIDLIVKYLKELIGVYRNEFSDLRKAVKAEDG